MSYIADRITGLDEAAKEVASNHASVSPVSSSIPDGPILFTILPSPGEGLGCFSTTLIPAGTLILKETPLFAVGEPRTNSAVITAFSHLTSSQQEQYLALHAVNPNGLGSARVVDIFNSNAWQTGSRTSILVRAARFNHSCVPNTSFAWNPRLACVTIHAIIAIPANTQIKLSYEPPYQLRSQRREKLSAYGFVCSCVACGLGVVESDKSRARMASLDARIRVRRRRKGKAEVPKEALELVKLLQQEGLVGEALGLAYHDAADGWRKYGRLDLALKCALKELDVCIMCFGLDSPFVDATRALLREIEADISELR
jgi:SET domain